MRTSAPNNASQTSRASNASKGDDSASRSKHSDEPPAKGLVDRFKQAFAGHDAIDEDAVFGERGPGGDGEPAGEASEQRMVLSGDSEKAAPDEQTLDAEWVSVASLAFNQQMQTQSVTQTAATAAPAGNAAAFADLIEKHVKRLLVSEGGADRDGSKVMLQMADTVLPGTVLMLSKTDTGWLLEAESETHESDRAFRELAPELTARFVARDLGALTVAPRRDHS